MYEKYGNYTNVRIDLAPGIYIFDNKSATGKSYLLKTLKALSLSGEPVDGYTYSDYIRGQSLADYIGNRNNLRYLMIDRYDMYINEFIEDIERISDKCTVMIDCKGPTALEYEQCHISLGDRSLEVFGDEVYI